MSIKDWAALMAAVAAVVVALPAIPRSRARPYWMSGGVLLVLLALGLAFVPARVPDPAPYPSPSAPGRDVSRAAFLAQAEKVCADHRPFTQAMPDRTTQSEAFGRWLRRITASNQGVLDPMAAVKRPRADEDLLTDLFAQRQHANDVFLRSAGAFEAGGSATGEQFLASAVGVEAAYREAAREYGFSICIGSDTPGR